MAHPAFIIHRSSDGQFHFDLTARNGQKILHSELYTTKSSCENGITSVKSNSQDDNRYARKESSNGQHYFNLKATNGQVIGTSEMYTTTSARENGIASVKENAPKAAVDDRT